MHTEMILAATLAALLLCYLIYAVVYPEKF